MYIVDLLCEDVRIFAIQETWLQRNVLFYNLNYPLFLMLCKILKHGGFS